MSNRDYDYLFKLVIIGNSGVGKSSLLLRYTDDTFTENYISTIGVDFKFKTFPLDGKKLKLQIWDTAGQERFRTITNSYYKGADAMIIVYDSTCQQSFDEIEKSWMEEIQKHADKNTTILLIGNKCDLSNKIVNSDIAQQYAKQRSMLFYEASAKTGQGINDAFEGLARLLIILRDSKQLEKKQKRKSKQQNSQQTNEETPKPFETSLQPQQNINLWLRQNDKGEKKEQQCSC